jgi:hypothetical protein
MNRGDPLLFRCGLCGRGVQRELPSTITYSQKFRGSAQRKSAHTFPQNSLAFFGCAYEQVPSEVNATVSHWVKNRWMEFFGKDNAA